MAELRNPLRGIDAPYDTYAKNELVYDSLHPSRSEPKRRTVGSTEPQQRARAHVHSSSATQSINDATSTVVSLDTKDFDTVGLFVSNQFVIPATGKITGAWLIHGLVTFAAAAAGARHLHIRKNSSTVLIDVHEHGTNDEQTLQASILINDPIAGDAFDLVVLQDSGGALNILKNPEETFFEIIHLW